MRDILQVNWSSLKSFMAILVTPTQDYEILSSWNSHKFRVEVTKIAIFFFKLDQSTWKMFQIEANTYGFECRLIFGANIWFSYDL